MTVEPPSQSKIIDIKRAADLTAAAAAVTSVGSLMDNIQGPAAEPDSTCNLANDQNHIKLAASTVSDKIVPEQSSQCSALCKKSVNKAAIFQSADMSSGEAVKPAGGISVNGSSGAISGHLVNNGGVAKSNGNEIVDYMSHPPEDKVTNSTDAEALTSQVSDICLTDCENKCNLSQQNKNNLAFEATTTVPSVINNSSETVESSESNCDAPISRSCKNEDKTIVDSTHGINSESKQKLSTERQSCDLEIETHLGNINSQDTSVSLGTSELYVGSVHAVAPTSNECLNDEANGTGEDTIRFIVYESERQMPDIMRLITKDLSEPYSIYTYRYFIHNWPQLCFLAKDEEKYIGAIVSKLDSHKKLVRRGYIAMLAVDKEYRKRGIGSQLVVRTIRGMISLGCDEVVLETEITNKAALHLYENLGFVRDKRLFRYYLNGVDALRLKLWLR